MKGKKILSSGKLLTLMKIGIAQTMIAFVICGVSLAHDNHAQVLDKQVTVDLSNAPLEQVLHELAVQADVKFAYGLDHVNLRGCGERGGPSRRNDATAAQPMPARPAPATRIRARAGVP